MLKFKMGSYDRPEDLRKVPDNVGRRLMPTVIDEKARLTPQAVWCSLPYDDSDLTKGYEDVTYVRFANAINKLSWFIHEKLGPSDCFETIAYMGRPDIRYHVVQMAIIKTGHKVLFSSHMNSRAGHLSLMEKTNVKFMLVASGVEVDDILAQRSMEHVVIPELDELLAADQIRVYPYIKTFDEAKNDPYLIVHTSGSTGIPKPIIYNHGQMSTIDNHGLISGTHQASGLPIRTWFTNPLKPLRMMIPFLHFHAICAAAAMPGTVFGDLVYIPGFRNRMVTLDDVLPILEHCNAETALLSPAMAEYIARKPEAGPIVSRLSKCLYAGAPLTEHAGNILSQYTNLQNQWGMTETVKLVDLETEPEDFAYTGWDTQQSGISFEPRGGKLYEMVVRRTEESYPNAGVFWRCPEDDELRPGDLWSPHPDPKKSAYLWKYEGRVDDMIIWKDGTNLNPLYYESKHSEHDLVRSAIMAGTNHCQAVLLLELYPGDHGNEAEIVSQLWEESVARVNSFAPTSGRIAKTHIILASADKPFRRTVKDSVSRKTTLKLYETELKEIYRCYGDIAMRLDGRLHED